MLYKRKPERSTRKSTHMGWGSSQPYISFVASVNTHNHSEKVRLVFPASEKRIKVWLRQNPLPSLKKK